MELKCDALTIKDDTGRLNTFRHVVVTIEQIMGDRYYKVDHEKGVDYYNPNHIIFLSF